MWLAFIGNMSMTTCANACMCITYNDTIKYMYVLFVSLNELNNAYSVIYFTDDVLLLLNDVLRVTDETICLQCLTSLCD